jgi:hypothetical protein
MREKESEERISEVRREERVKRETSENVCGDPSIRGT